MQTSTKNISIIETQFVQLFSEANPLQMDCGEKFSPITVAYETYGELNSAGDNAILVCHALTGNAHAAGYSSDDSKSVGWWNAIIGEGKALDSKKYFVISSNFLGSCYGTTGSSSINLQTGKPYGFSFPQMTVRDMVRVQKSLIDFLGVKKLHTIIGGSLGGMQVLEWSLLYPELVRSIIPIATSAHHSPWCIGLNDLSRQAIYNDPNWRAGNYYDYGQPEKGLSLARQIAMVTYRSDISFQHRFKRERIKTNGNPRTYRFDMTNHFQVENYLRYQGKKLVDRFDANTYLQITRAMDLHDIGFERGAVSDVLAAITMPTLCVGIDSDVLYPVHEQKEIAKHIPHAEYAEITSLYGHDAFLIEHEQISKLIQNFFTLLQ